MMPSTQNDHIHYNGFVSSGSELDGSQDHSFFSESTESEIETNGSSDIRRQQKLGNINLWQESKADLSKNGSIANGFSKMTRKSRLQGDGRGGYINLETSSHENITTSSASDDDFEDIPLKSPSDEIIIFQQPLSPKYNKGPVDCRKQLLKDGYRLDEQSDDEDLDLVMPLGKGVSWCSCERYCVIQ